MLKPKKKMIYTILFIYWYQQSNRIAWKMQFTFYTVKKKSDKMQKYIKILHDSDFFYIPVYLQNFSLCKNTGLNCILMYSIIVKQALQQFKKCSIHFLSFENKLKITSSLFFTSKVSKLYKQYLWKHEY